MSMRNHIIRAFIVVLMLMQQQGFGLATMPVLVKPKHQFSATSAALRSLFCVVNPHADETLLAYARVVAFDLAFTDQFHITRYQTKAFLSENQLDKQFMQGIPLCLELSSVTQRGDASVMHVTIKVRETASHDTIFNKQMAVKKDRLVQEAHACADYLIGLLTNRKSIALTTLAYCVQKSTNRKALIVGDYAGFASSAVIDDGCLNVAPRWHASLPLIFYSRITATSGDLCSLDVRTGAKKVICAYEGLSMQPSCSEDGTAVVLCMSSDKGNLELFMYDQTLSAQKGRRLFKQLTHNGGNNSSPCYLPNGDIVFCSDFEMRQPQVYYLNVAKKMCYRLTRSGSGYCAAPSYSKARNAIVYTRYHQPDECFQLFEISLAHPKEQQLTYGPGDKLEPSWSPCGNYVACVLDRFDGGTKTKIPQIAVLNCVSKKLQVVTQGDEAKSFPVWVEGVYYTLQGCQ